MNTQTYTSSTEEVPIHIDQMGIIQYWTDTLNKKVLPILQLSNSSDLPPDTENQLLDFLEWAEEYPNDGLEYITQSVDLMSVIFVINQHLTRLECDLANSNNTVLNINNNPNDTFDIDVTDGIGDIIETEVYIDSYSVTYDTNTCLTFSELVRKIQEKFDNFGYNTKEQIVNDSRFKTKDLAVVPPSLPKFNSDSVKRLPIIPNNKGNVPPPLTSTRNAVQLVFSVGVGKNTPPAYERLEIIE